MNTFRATLHWIVAAAALVSFVVAAAQTPRANEQAGGESSANALAASKSYPRDLVQKGRALFRQDCSFCHGRDAGGGETGPDLTRSKVVAADDDGDKIAPVIRSGRPDKGMPPFDRSEEQIASLVAFIHTQRNRALTGTGRNGGGRKGVDPSDLQTGNAEAGKRYFNGTGGCATCHSPTGDLAGVATRHKGLELEEQMLYPRNTKAKITVKVPSGQTFEGTLAYKDEFTVGLIDASGTYRSWRTRDVQYKIDAPAEAHVELLGKYSDADVHDLMAYLQTLR